MKLVKTVPILILLLTLSIPAFAQYVDRDDSVRFEDEFNNDEFMIAGRFRAIGIPSFVWDFWYDQHANHWSGQNNFSYGGEFVWRKHGSLEIGFAIDYADISMPSEFWLENGKAAVDQDWTQFDLQILSAVFFTQWYWNPQPWISPFVGVGLGPALVLGDVTEYNPRNGSPCRTEAAKGVFSSDQCLEKGEPNLDRDFDPGEKETAIPPVIPMLQFGGGVRFNIAKHGMLKLEMGFQDYFYFGGGLGFQW